MPFSECPHRICQAAGTVAVALSNAKRCSRCARVRAITKLHPTSSERPMLDPAKFETEFDGKPVALFVIENSRGMRAAITNYGAKIEQILVPDRAGNFGDVALGYGSIEAVRTGQPSMGSFIGRFAN